MAAVLLSVTGSAFAVPAMPGIVEKHLDDGSVINVRIFGDEFGRYVLTEDGWPIVMSNGSAYFAEKGVDGHLYPTEHNAVVRDAAAQAWLAGQDKDALVKVAGNMVAKAHKINAKFKNPGLFESSFPHKGSPRAIVILVEYQDVKCKLDNPQDYFSNMLNEEGFAQWGGTGSVRDYFIESSMGQFKPTFDFYGPVTLPENMAYYGANVRTSEGEFDAHAEEMVIHACQILDDTVDFTEYDHDGDGLIDNVFIFYAGYGENAGGSASSVWPHSWDVRGACPDTEFIFDGVQLGQYACSNEWRSNRPDGIGTFVHEFSHVLGLPDLYVTTGGPGFTAGNFSVLASGPYNNLSRTPPAYSAYERYALEWIEPVLLDKPDNITLGHILTTNDAAIIFSPDNSNEYFLFENRQLKGSDAFIPWHGMLVWHVDYDEELWQTGGVNNVPAHHHVDLVEADNLLSENTRDGDPFPGVKNVTSFTAGTRPAFKDWAGNPMPGITDIVESRNGMITFKFDGGLPDSAIPEALPATEVASYSFTANWKAVDNAEKYLIDVFVGAEEEPFISAELAGDVISYEVRDIAPETDFAYTIRSLQPGKGVSPESERICVTTGPMTFEWNQVVAYDPVDTDSRSFIASWEPVEGAVEYIVDLFQKNITDMDTDLQEFLGGPEALPIGWATNSSAVFEYSSYSGNAVPALRFSDNSVIQSPEYDCPVYSVSFWHRGANNSKGSELVVSALVDGDWKEIGAVEITEDEGGRIDEVKGFPYGSKAVKIAYRRVGTKRGPVAIDDITVCTEKGFEKVAIPGFEKISVFDADNTRVMNLEAQTEYFYTVTAFDGELYSRESVPVRVFTREEGYLSGIDGVINREDTEPEYFNLQGMKVKAPAAGNIYIVRRGDRTTKELAR